MAIDPNAPNSQGRHVNGTHGTIPNDLSENGEEDYFSDASSGMTELDGPEDFARHFQEREGRLFHSHGGSPYPLPVDTPEQERLEALHRIVRRVLRANFVGPVQEVLMQDATHRKRVLDVCTGTGTWPMDMARQFPHVKFNAFDIVPIATRLPLPNVHFEMHNVAEPFRWDPDTMDLIHARHNDMSVANYPAMLGEAARVLRRGGLFISGEWDRAPVFQQLAPGQLVVPPGISRLTSFIDNVLYTRRGVCPIAPHIPHWLAASGQFENITAESFSVPIGDWHPEPEQQELGQEARAICIQYAESLKPLLKESGLGDFEIQEMIIGFLAEIQNTSGIVWIFRTVHARKI